MSDDKFFKVEDSKYGDVIFLNEYNGSISLIAGNDGDKGTFQRWCKPQTGRDKFADKAIPMKVSLGGKECAIGMLQDILASLTEVPLSSADDDLPF